MVCGFGKLVCGPRSDVEGLPKGFKEPRRVGLKDLKGFAWKRKVVGRLEGANGGLLRVDTAL